MNKFAIIVAGGAGSRFPASIPKQFVLLKSRPLLLYALEVFYHADEKIEILLVLPGNFFDHWNELCKKYNIQIPHKTIEGGESRFYSVRNGLDHISGKGLVAIHDGARPLVSKTLITRAFDEASIHGNAIPCIRLQESVRMLREDTNYPVNRDLLRMIQTPQCFDISLIKKAYRQDFQNDFTDDATVLESNGVKIHLFEGSRNNIKITYPEDLDIAAQLLSI